MINVQYYEFYEVYAYYDVDTRGRQLIFYGGPDNF